MHTLPPADGFRILLFIRMLNRVEWQAAFR